MQPCGKTPIFQHQKRVIGHVPCCHKPRNMFGRRRVKPPKENSNDAAIKQAEEALARVREEAEALVQQFNQVTPLYVADLAQHLMKDAVSNKPEVTQSLGETLLRELKGKFKESIDAIPSWSEQKLKSVRWAHLEPFPRERNHWACSVLLEKTIKSLDDVVRDLVGGVGSLLLEYGYERNEKQPLVPIWQVRPGDTPRYSYGLPDLDSPHAKKFQELLVHYRAFITENYQEATAALQKAIQEKKAAEAQALWDKV